jgi:hypothetical protein
MAKREISLTKHYTELTMDVHDPHKNGDEHMYPLFSTSAKHWRAEKVQKPLYLLINLALYDLWSYNEALKWLFKQISL